MILKYKIFFLKHFPIFYAVWVFNSSAVKCDEKLGIVSPKKIRYTILLTLCSLLYSIIISCLDIYIWNYGDETKQETERQRSNQLRSPVLHVVVIMMEVQYAVVVYNVSQRFFRLNKNLENIFNSGKITDQFKKDFGLGAHYSLFYDYLFKIIFQNK